MKYMLIFLCMTMGLQPLLSQELNKEVYVVKPYEPTLSDANKYNFLPATTDLGTTTPVFQYSITPKRLTSSFEPDPIKAAKTVTTSLPKIYNSWLKLGLGNYTSPLVEFNISNLHSRDYAYGAYLTHKSSQGKVRLDNNDKVFAGYVVNKVNVYGKRFYSKSTLWGNLRFDQHAFSYYGYNTSAFAEPPDTDRDSLRQRTFKPGLDVGIKSNYSSADQLNYDISADLDYFIDKPRNKETSLVVRSTFSKTMFEMLGGLDLSVDYSRLNATTDSITNTIIRFNPWISKSSADWQFKVGFEGVADIANITHYYFYPRANLDIIIIKDVLVPFVGVSGELQKNNYQHLFDENQFISPGLYRKNTSSNFVVYGGLKGSLSEYIRFRADVTFTVYKNFLLFVNDTTTHPLLLPLQNQFTAVYDDVNLATYHGQLVINPNSDLEIGIDGKYFDYKTFEEKEAWHRPDFTLSVDASYKTAGKFEFGAGIHIIGNRWVPDKISPDNRMKIKPALDANFSLQYHYSRLFTVFADFHNLAERSYLLWNQYPSQRFNFMFGFTYKL